MHCSCHALHCSVLAVLCLHSVSSRCSPYVSAMQDKPLEVFWHMLDCASVYNMPKLLACCEHHLAIDPLQRFKVLPASFASEQQLPGCSLLRVADALRAAFHKMAVDHASPKMPLERCDCPCCHIVRARRSLQNYTTEHTQPAFPFTAGSFAASQAGSSNLSSSSMNFPACICRKSSSGSGRGAGLAEYVPGPQEFLRVA